MRAMPREVEAAQSVGQLEAVLLDVEAAVAALPEEEQRAYREAQESVVRARREGERIAGEIWIG